MLDCYSALFVRLKLRQKIAKICFAHYWCVPPHSHHRPNLDQKSNSFRVVNPYPPLIALIKRSAFCRSEGPALHQSQSAFTNWSWQSRPDCQRLASSLVCLFPRECGPPRHPLLLLDLLQVPRILFFFQVSSQLMEQVSLVSLYGLVTRPKRCWLGRQENSWHQS